MKKVVTNVHNNDIREKIKRMEHFNSHYGYYLLWLNKIIHVLKIEMVLLLALQALWILLVKSFSWASTYRDLHVSV
jgi:hypothetical protein